MRGVRSTSEFGLQARQTRCLFRASTNEGMTSRCPGDSLSRIAKDIRPWCLDKLGSNLGPIAAENHAFRPNETHYRPKRINKLAHRWLIRDQGVGGSNPLSPTIRINNLQSIRQVEHATLLVQVCQLRPLPVPVETAVGVHQRPFAVCCRHSDQNSSPYPPPRSQPTCAHPTMSCCSLRGSLESQSDPCCRAPLQVERLCDASG